MEPGLNTFGEYEICFGNEFHIKNTNGYNNNKIIRFLCKWY